MCVKMFYFWILENIAKVFKLLSYNANPLATNYKRIFLWNFLILQRLTVRSFKKGILVLSSIGIQSMHFHIPLCVIVDSDNLSRWASKYQMFWLKIFRNWNFEGVVTSAILLWINTPHLTFNEICKYIECSMNYISL